MRDEKRKGKTEARSRSRGQELVAGTEPNLFSHLFPPSRERERNGVRTGKTEISRYLCLLGFVDFGGFRWTCGWKRGGTNPNPTSFEHTYPVHAQIAS